MACACLKRPSAFKSVRPLPPPPPPRRPASMCVCHTTSTCEREAAAYRFAARARHSQHALVVRAPGSDQQQFPPPTNRLTPRQPRIHKYMCALLPAYKQESPTLLTLGPHESTHTRSHSVRIQCMCTCGHIFEYVRAYVRACVCVCVCGLDSGDLFRAQTHTYAHSHTHAHTHILPSRARSGIIVVIVVVGDVRTDNACSRKSAQF